MKEQKLETSQAFHVWFICYISLFSLIRKRGEKTCKAKQLFKIRQRPQQSLVSAGRFWKATLRWHCGILDIKKCALFANKDGFPYLPALQPQPGTWENQAGFVLAWDSCRPNSAVSYTCATLLPPSGNSLTIPLMRQERIQMPLA